MDVRAYSLQHGPFSLSKAPSGSFTIRDADAIFIRNRTGVWCEVQACPGYGEKLLWMGAVAGTPSIHFIDAKYLFYSICNCTTMIGQPTPQQWPRTIGSGSMVSMNQRSSSGRSRPYLRLSPQKQLIYPSRSVLLQPSAGPRPPPPPPPYTEKVEQRFKPEGKVSGNATASPP